MPALDPVHPAYNDIVDALAKKPGLSVAELHGQLGKSKNRESRVTVQHLYRLVGRLSEDGVVRRVDGRLSLDDAWVGQLSSFAENAKRIAAAAARTVQVFPLPPGETRRFEAGSARDALALWNDLLLKMHRASPQSVFTVSAAHAWWALPPLDAAADAMRTVSAAGVWCGVLLHGDTLLDRRAAAVTEPFEVRVAGKPQEAAILAAVGEHVLECLLPAPSLRLFDFVFSSAGEDLPDGRLLEDICDQRAECAVTLARNRRKATDAAAGIAKFFH